MNSLPMVFIISTPGEFHSTYDYTLYLFCFTWPVEFYITGMVHYK